jgi:hypothetical protein
MLPPGWTLGPEVGVGNPLRSVRADSNDNRRCPYPVFVFPTSDFLGAFAARSPGVGRPLPGGSDWVGTEAVPVAKLSAAVVTAIEPVVISLSLKLDRYRLHGLYRWCVPPGQQVVLAGRRAMRPCLAQCTALNAVHVRMAKL